ncbi:MAG TPA: YihY/virulence factor BrkB family protein [Actinomycetota bacterium]|nr:YihY/virulence factor BrkB family protein [Actinomycetota bacterium]
MSTANPVPETWELTGDDAKETIKRTDRKRLVKDAFSRLRAADGFSHARSMGFLLILVFVQVIIAAVGIASALGTGGLSRTIVKTLQSIVPGPAGKVLTQAVHQAHQSSSSGQWIAIVLGTVAALVTGTTLMGQLERALNRIYGIEQDRPALRKYGRAFLLAISAGVLAVLAFVAIGIGGAVATSIAGDTASTIWNVVRWPVGVGLLTASSAMVLRWSPRRHQPGWSWLSMGALAGVGLMAMVTLALNLFFQFSGSFGDTYGPLAGIIALAFWAYFTSAAFLSGAALSAQLEAVRAGAADPLSARKADASEPRPAVSASMPAVQQAS